MLVVLTLIGSIGLFLYAMQLISESLQKIAGDHLRHVQSAMTGHTFKAMLTGLGFTAFVQSSTVTTLMVVSYVNAGLISLTQSLAVIMGANIGTTITAWIIATIGFRFDVIVWAFPIIALALPLFSSRRSTTNAWGELLLGMALLLISLAALEGAFLQLGTPAFATGLQGNADVASWAVMLTVLALILGCILFTMAARSSSAAFAVILLMCVAGWIPFELGCGLIIFANIATCILPYWASRKGNAAARRAALGHLLFNTTGMIWAIFAIHFCMPQICSLCQFIGLGDPTTTEGAPLGLAFFHTAFNVITMCLFLPLSKVIAKPFTRITDQSDEKDQAFKLKYIDLSDLPSSGEMALVQVSKETSRYAENVYQMFTFIRQMVKEPMGSERQLDLMSRIRTMEEDSDKAELEIAQFLNKIEPQTLSMSGEMLCRGLYKVVEELESIADSIFHCSTTLYQKSEQLIRFSPTMNKDLGHMLQLTDDAMHHMTHVLSLDEVPANALDRAYNYEDEINNLRNQLRHQMLDALERREVEFQQHTSFMFLINECEKIGDYVINVIAAASI